MNCNILHSLQQMAIGKIAIGIFYDSKIEEILLKERNYPLKVFSLRCNRNKNELWKLIQMKTFEKLPYLPPFFQTKVFNYIHALQMESENWIQDHSVLLNLHQLYCRLAFKKFFCWKSNGTINRIETAKKILRNKSLGPNTRFRLACSYFLEKEVLSIWYGEVSKKGLGRKRTNWAVKFWLKWLRKGCVTPWRLMVDDYFNSAYLGSDIPIRFSDLYPYFSQENKVRYLTHFKSDEFFSYISELDEAEQMELLQLDPETALLNCLNWPFQTLFIDILNLLESHGRVIYFVAIYLNIISRIIYGIHDFDYIELVKELWNHSPSFTREVKRSKISCKITEAIINYDADSQSLPLGEILEACIFSP